MKLTIALSVAASLAISAGALAQAGSGVSITNNNVTWTQPDWPTTNTAAASTWMPASQPNAFTVNDLPLGVNSFTNFANQNGWWYRFSTAGGAELRERNFANLGPATIVGNQATWTFSLASTNASLPDVVNAVLTQTVTGSGNQQGSMSQSLTLTNNGATNVSIRLFNWMKYHAGFTLSSSNAVVGALGSVKSTNNNSWAFPVSVTMATDGSGTGSWRADTASTSSGILSLLSDSSILGSPLNNQINALGVTSGNVSNLSNAFVWDVTIPAGSSVTIGDSLTVVPAPASLALVGLGGLIAGRRRR